MSRTGDFFQKNLAAVMMLVFVAAMYLAILSVRQPEPTEAPVVAPPSRITAEALRSREELFMERVKKNPSLIGGAMIALLFVITAGFAVDTYGIGRAWKGKAVFSRTAEVPAARWGFSEILFVAALVFFAEAVILMAEMAVLPFLEVKINHDLLIMTNSLLRDAVVAFSVIAVVRRLGHSARDLGLTVTAWLKNVCTGIVAYVAVVPALLATLVAVSMIARLFSYEPPPQAVVQMYLSESSEKYLLFFTLFVAGAGPVFEEIFFRGFAYGFFRTRYGVVRAAIFSSLLFTLMHVSLIAALPIFLLGIFLAVLYEKTGSLVPSIAAHVVHNLIMVCLTLFFKSVSA